MNEQLPALEGINASGAHVIEESKQVVDTAALQARIAQMNERWENLQNVIEER